MQEIKEAIHVRNAGAGETHWNAMFHNANNTKSADASSHSLSSLWHR